MKTNIILLSLFLTFNTFADGLDRYDVILKSTLNPSEYIYDITKVGKSQSKVEIFQEVVPKNKSITSSSVSEIGVVFYNSKSKSVGQKNLGIKKAQLNNKFNLLNLRDVSALDIVNQDGKTFLVIKDNFKDFQKIEGVFDKSAGSRYEIKFVKGDANSLKSSSREKFMAEFTQESLASYVKDLVKITYFFIASLNEVTFDLEKIDIKTDIQGKAILERIEQGKSQVILRLPKVMIDAKLVDQKTKGEVPATEKDLKKISYDIKQLEEILPQ